MSKNLRPEDVERSIKHNLKEEAGSITLSKEQAQTLLDRLIDYRKRINKVDARWQKKYSKVKEELYWVEWHREHARSRLDPIMAKVNISMEDVDITSLLIEEIEKIRGRIVAHRLIYGQAFDTEADGETVGVLKAAIAAAIGEKKKWFGYREEAEKKRRARRSPLLALAEDVWVGLSDKSSSDINKA